MKKILFLLCGLFLLISPAWGQGRYDDRFDRSQNKQEYGDKARDHYREQQQQREEMNQKLEQQRRELNQLRRQQEKFQQQRQLDELDGIMNRRFK